MVKHSKGKTFLGRLESSFVNQLRKVENKTKGMNYMQSKKGFINLIIGLLLGFMIITMLVTLLPGFSQMTDFALGSNALNCVGYVDSDMSDGNQSYNSTIGTKSAIGCLAMKLFLPYIILAILIGLVVKILYDKGQGQQPGYY